MSPSKAARALRRILKPAPPPMTQQGLADELGVTQQAVSAWLKGITRPSPERIKRIEELLGVPATDWVANADGVAAELDSGTDVTAEADESGAHRAAEASRCGTDD